jgi:O-acetyl-ADP-ribose deacetylase (regulator of RNase III)
MNSDNPLLKTSFTFGTTNVKIVFGDVLDTDVQAEVLVSSDDNYLTMSGGLARRLADVAGNDYIRETQKSAPLRGGDVIVTEPYRIRQSLTSVKNIFHAAVIDYDSYDLVTENIVGQVTLACLEKAEDLGLKRILMPPLATGAARLLSIQSCANQMCRAIKLFLGQRRNLDTIYLILHVSPKEPRPTDQASLSEKHRAFLVEANLVLGVPYDPTLFTLQSHDYYISQKAVQEIKELLVGKVKKQRHALIVSGARIGKSALLDYIYWEAYQTDNALGAERCVARVVLNHVHKQTPVSLLYRKLLISLNDTGVTSVADTKIRKTYAQLEMNFDQFNQFLNENAEQFKNIVFLVDDLPRLVKIQDGQGWPELEKLGDKVQFIFTSTDDDQYQSLWNELPKPFRDSVKIVHLQCVTDQEREEWVNNLYHKYLERDAEDAEQDFIAAEAGNHPYLLSLTLHALIQSVKRNALTSYDEYQKRLDSYNFDTYQREVRDAIQKPRAVFFDELLTSAYLDENDLGVLEILAQLDGSNEPDTQRKRGALDPMRLDRLEERGYLITTQAGVHEFMSPKFAEWVKNYFGIGHPSVPAGNIRITLLRAETPADNTTATAATVSRIRTLVRSKGAINYWFEKVIEPDVRSEGLEYFRELVAHLQHPETVKTPGELESVGRLTNLKEVGDFILKRFMTTQIRPYLQNASSGTTITFEVEDLLANIPWELMLMAIAKDATDNRFSTGRILIPEAVVSMARDNVDWQKEAKPIKALLIANPTGDLQIAEDEVNAIKDTLVRDGRFQVKILPAAERTKPAIQSELGSGQYGLVHYSGHSYFDGVQSGWLLAGRTPFKISEIMDSLSEKPPAMVFCSSCESATPGDPMPQEKAENQAPDLAQAFIKMGVQAYIGTMWNVEAMMACDLATTFYENLFVDQGAKYTLAESLRQAKDCVKQPGNEVSWAAYTLYGDPTLRITDLFPSN